MMFLNRKKDLLADARASVEARQNAFRTAFEALPRAGKCAMLAEAIRTLPPGDVDTLHRQLSDMHWLTVKVEGM